MSRIAALLAGCLPGYALAREFYCDPDVFTHDMTLLLDRWSLAGHVSELPAAGDFLLHELGAESAIVVRGADGAIRALANVCRHRGSRLCTTPRGHLSRLTCPYHAWTYALDGELRGAPHMPEGFDPAAHGLLALSVAVIGGLIFVSFGQAPPALAPAAAALEAFTAHYGWAEARIAARASYRVQANWKLVLENYHECYHCGPAHPEFSRLHALARPERRTLAGTDRESWTTAGEEPFRVMRSALAGSCRTGSQDGQPLAPAMGAAAFDGQCTFAELGFLSAFLAYPDHGIAYRFRPRSLLETEMEVLWLVHHAASPDPAALIWLWDVTSQADKRIIEHNQHGIASRAYRPGPYSRMEPATRMFTERYLAEAGRGVEDARPGSAAPWTRSGA